MLDCIVSAIILLGNVRRTSICCQVFWRFWEDLTSSSQQGNSGQWCTIYSHDTYSKQQKPKRIICVILQTHVLSLISFICQYVSRSHVHLTKVIIYNLCTYTQTWICIFVWHGFLNCSDILFLNIICKICEIILIKSTWPYFTMFYVQMHSKPQVR